MPITDRDDVLAIAIFDKIMLNKVSLGLNDVLYGNHLQLPSAKVVVVQALGKRRELAGASSPGGRTENMLLVGIDLHWSKVGAESEERRAVDAKGYEIEQLLHSDVQVGGTIIHGFVTQVDRGESNLGGMFRSVKMLYTGKTKTYLSQS